MRLVLLDLDGTLIRGNSFWIWVRHWVLRPSRLAGLSWPGLVLRLVRYLTLRALGQTSHSVFRDSLCEEWARLADRCPHEAESVLRRVGRDVRNDVRPDVSAFAATRGDVVVLATAAPAPLADELARALAIPVVAIGCTTWHSKASAVRERYPAMRSFELITDHEADAYLLDEAEHTWLVRPTDELLRRSEGRTDVSVLEVEDE